MASKARFTNIAPVFIAQDLEATVSFYTEKLRFTSAEHFDKHEAFAAVYRDDIEIIVVKGKHGFDLHDIPPECDISAPVASRAASRLP